MTSPPVPAAVLAWVATSTGAGGARWSRRLAGGTHAVTDVVRLDDDRDVVLRRFPTGDTAVRREVAVLGHVAGLGDLAPRLLAADDDGARTGTPAVVTTLVPGAADILPHDVPQFARELGRALATVHAQPVPVGLPDVLGPAAPDGVTGPRLERAWARMSREGRVLSHHDFWSGNTLFRDGRLSGIVDWSGAGLAPRGFDLSWARLDMYLMFDSATVDVFTAAYQSAAGVVVADVDLWDLRAAAHAHPDVESWAPNYQQLGRTDLGPRTLRQRLTTWERLLA